jgi:transposase
MEDVLELLAEPYDPLRPVACLDEKPVQLLEDTREARPVREGQPALQDYEYRRKGTANIFVVLEPLRGWRHLDVTAQRTKLDFAEQMKQLVDVHYPTAERIRLVVDNLNTHGPASLYAAYEPAEALRIRKRLEFHYTPKHGSWLNPAECEISALERQCLRRRIPDREMLTLQTKAWAMPRNQDRVTIKWRFSTKDARTKLRHLYPDLSNRIIATED